MRKTATPIKAATTKNKTNFLKLNFEAFFFFEDLALEDFILM
jgi:hypothetical protein